MKHLSRWRKRKQYAISLVTASENDVGQTESRTVRYVEMWCFGLDFGSSFVKLKLTWNGRTVEGDSPVSMCSCGLVYILE